MYTTSGAVGAWVVELEDGGSRKCERTLRVARATRFYDDTQLRTLAHYAPPVDTQEGIRVSVDYFKSLYRPA